jgi:hypothetical protein
MQHAELRKQIIPFLEKLLVMTHRHHDRHGSAVFLDPHRRSGGFVE